MTKYRKYVGGGGLHSPIIGNMHNTWIGGVV